MKYRQYLNEILGKKSQIMALRFLCGFPGGLGIRELSRRIGVSEPNLAAVLKDLARQGVLRSSRHGTSLVFSLNRGHYLASAVIIPLFEQERKALDELAAFITRQLKTKFISMILFGSAARGDESIGSDLDIAFIVSDLAVKEAIEKELEDIGIKTLEKFGNFVSPYIIIKSDFIKRHSAGDSLIRNIAKEGKVLGGCLISELYEV
jgi:predicted nucleotidyltransferase